MTVAKGAAEEDGEDGEDKEAYLASVLGMGAGKNEMESRAATPILTSETFLCHETLRPPSRVAVDKSCKLKMHPLSPRSRY